MKNNSLKLLGTMAIALLLSSCGPSPQEYLLSRNQELEKENQKLKLEELKVFQLDCCQKIEEAQLAAGQEKEVRQKKVRKNKLEIKKTEQDYQKKLKTIEDFYKKEIEAKKKELGL